MAASRFSPAVRGALVERFAAGLSLADACRAVGLSEKTVKTWITRGRREQDGPYAEFVAQVDEARKAAKARPAPMDSEELFRVVSSTARKGSVQAMKLYWEMLRAEHPDSVDEAPPDPLAELDELAARRAARA